MSAPGLVESAGRGPGRGPDPAVFPFATGTPGLPRWLLLASRPVPITAARSGRSSVCGHSCRTRLSDLRPRAVAHCATASPKASEHRAIAARIRCGTHTRGGLKSPKIAQEGLNEATILSLVSHGMGVGWVNGTARGRCPEGVAILSVADLEMPLALLLVWRRDNTSPLLANFLGEVRCLTELRTK